MRTYEITTNHVPRDVVDGWSVPQSVREEFDYIDWPAIERGEDSASFVQYRGEWFDLSDMPLAPEDLRQLGWDGFASDSYFSGIVVRYVGEDLDSVVMGTLYVSDGE